jgi:hypothetical protein
MRHSPPRFRRAAMGTGHAAIPLGQRTNNERWLLYSLTCTASASAYPQTASRTPQSSLASQQGSLGYSTEKGILRARLVVS